MYYILICKGSLKYFHDFILFQCLQLLYGGSLELETTNIASLLKISIHLELNELFEHCAKWLKENSMENSAAQLIKSKSTESRLKVANMLDMVYNAADNHDDSRRATTSSVDQFGCPDESSKYDNILVENQICLERISSDVTAHEISDSVLNVYYNLNKFWQHNIDYISYQ